ncbi:unnamed protein product, partial [marine sediment metagenome]
RYKISFLLKSFKVIKFLFLKLTDIIISLLRLPYHGNIIHNAEFY